MTYQAASAGRPSYLAKEISRGAHRSSSHTTQYLDWLAEGVLGAWKPASDALAFCAQYEKKLFDRTLQHKVDKGMSNGGDTLTAIRHPELQAQGRDVSMSVFLGRYG